MRCPISILSILILLLAACAGPNTPVESPPPEPRPEDPSATQLPSQPLTEPPPDLWAPAKGDESMQRSAVTIDAFDILVLESFPPQFRLRVVGTLPSACHELRAVVAEPDARNQIQAQVWALSDPNAGCIAAVEPFDISLRLGSFAEGEYTVLLNGEVVGTIRP